MTFKQLFRTLDKYMSDGHDVVYFFRELMEMITDVSEVDWDTEKDPATKLTSEQAIRNFTKRGPSKRLAKSIVNNLTPETLKERIEERPEATRKLMAQDLKSFDSGVNSENVAEKVSTWMVECINAAAGLVEHDELEKQRIIEQSAHLKIKYGDYLLEEEGGYCPYPDCGRRLRYSSGGSISDCYEVNVIDDSNGPTVDNLIALCPRHHSAYLLNHPKKLIQQIKHNKQILSRHKTSADVIDDVSFERGVTEVITKIGSLKEGELEAITMDSNNISSKLDPQRDSVLYRTVCDYVNTYFMAIRRLFENLDRAGKVSYEGVQYNMRSLYHKQKGTNKTKMEIFCDITTRVEKACLCEPIYCQIFVSYFIQSCEVFDAVSK